MLKHGVARPLNIIFFPLQAFLKIRLLTPERAMFEIRSSVYVQVRFSVRQRANQPQNLVTPRDRWLGGQFKKKWHRVGSRLVHCSLMPNVPKKLIQGFFTCLGPSEAAKKSGHILGASIGMMESLPWNLVEPIQHNRSSATQNYPTDAA